MSGPDLIDITRALYGGAFLNEIVSMFESYFLIIN